MAILKLCLRISHFRPFWKSWPGLLHRGQSYLLRDATPIPLHEIDGRDPDRSREKHLYIQYLYVLIPITFDNICHNMCSMYIYIDMHNYIYDLWRVPAVQNTAAQLRHESGLGKGSHDQTRSSSCCLWHSLSFLIELIRSVSSEAAEISLQYLNEFFLETASSGMPWKLCKQCQDMPRQPIFSTTLIIQCLGLCSWETVVFQKVSISDFV